IRTIGLANIDKTTCRQGMVFNTLLQGDNPQLMKDVRKSVDPLQVLKLGKLSMELFFVSRDLFHALYGNGSPLTSGLRAESGRDHGCGHQMPWTRSAARCTLISTNRASFRC